jgi:hypothetical protein
LIIDQRFFRYHLRSFFCLVLLLSLLHLHSSCCYLIEIDRFCALPNQFCRVSWESLGLQLTFALPLWCKGTLRLLSLILDSQSLYVPKAWYGNSAAVRGGASPRIRCNVRMISPQLLIDCSAFRIKVLSVESLSETSQNCCTPCCSRECALCLFLSMMTYFSEVFSCPYVIVTSASGRVSRLQSRL